MTRPMTQDEKQRFRQYFPHLDVDRALVSGPETDVYNCIAWTVGVTNQWLWPGDRIEDFDAFYGHFGLRRVQRGEVAAWGQSLQAMTHGSISGPGHGPRWESKCGSDLRIEHGLDELRGPSYGQIVAYYTRDPAVASPPALLLNHHASFLRTSMYELTSAHDALLREATKACDEQLRQEFEARYASWRAALSADPQVRIASNPAVVRQMSTFQSIVELGQEVLPLVVAKLRDPSHFLAIQLYEELQPNVRLHVPIDAQDPRVVFGEQDRARRTLLHSFVAF